MKKLIFLLFLISSLYCDINSNFSTNYIDRSAIYVKAGQTFTAPFTGWYFSIFSTKRLLAADTETPFLKKENFKLEGEIAEKDFKIAGLEYVNNLNQIQLIAFRKYFETGKKKKFELSKEASFVIGIFSGIGITALTYWGIGQIK